MMRISAVEAWVAPWVVLLLVGCGESEATAGDTSAGGVGGGHAADGGRISTAGTTSAAGADAGGRPASGGVALTGGEGSGGTPSAGASSGGRVTTAGAGGSAGTGGYAADVCQGFPVPPCVVRCLDSCFCACPTNAGGGGSVGGYGGASAGGTGGGSSGQGGGTSLCEFTFTTPGVDSTTCQIAASSLNSCGDAAQCICASSSNVSVCVAGWTQPRGGATFSDYCYQPPTTGPRTLGEALQALAAAYQGTATVSEGCAALTATLVL